ncbi:unnamed protein product [Euphydryas editha]|uniref:Uncharacterized protein n=1 Tax=Euphydryas editha TaxID=104508 RepID=A0AAU9VC52_EUPED|nr:unnamed protein product [Euphydryas editha]
MTIVQTDKERKGVFDQDQERDLSKTKRVLSVSSPLDYGLKEENNKYTFKWFDGDQVPQSVTRITIIDDNTAENVDNDVVETSVNMEEDDAEQLEEERKPIIDSSDDSCEESDMYDTDTADSVYEKVE